MCYRLNFSVNPIHYKLYDIQKLLTFRIHLEIKQMIKKLKLNFEKKLKQNLRKTQKPPTPVELICQKSVQKKPCLQILQSFVCVTKQNTQTGKRKRRKRCHRCASCVSFSRTSGVQTS